MYQAAPEYGCVCQSREPYEVLYTRWMPYDDVLRLKLVEEMVEVYYNSNQFGKTLRAIEKLFDNPFALYEALGAFYDKKGVYGYFAYQDPPIRDFTGIPAGICR